MVTTRAQLSSLLSRLTNRFGSDHGTKLTLLGLNEPQSEALYGTPFGVRLLRHDPNQELSGQKAASICGLSLQAFLQIGPKPDSKRAHFSYWKPSTLAAWAANHCPSKQGNPRSELLGRIGALKPASA